MAHQVMKWLAIVYGHAMHCRMRPGCIAGLAPAFVAITSDVRSAGGHK